VGPFDLHDLLDEVRTLLRPLAERARVAIQLEPLAKDAELLGDEVRIRQVFINLVMNGLQACPQGGSICIATADAEGAIEVEVRDTGAGIPPEVVDRVFEPFFTTKGAGMGTGLGLPTSRRIVEEHGGTLTLARSGPGGTVFRVRLVRKPRHRAWEAQARRAAEVVSTSREDPTG
jgi:two-component system NtrC family sensor kinase